MENRDIILENARHLICKNSFNKVTVKMICEKSKISRKTFYVLYQDKYDILEQILIKDVINELDDLIDKFGKIELNRPIILEAMYQKIYENGEFYRKIVKTEAGDAMEVYLLNHLIKINRKIFMNTQMDDKEREYVTYFYASSQIMLIKKWILDNYILTPVELANNYQKWAVNAILSNYLI
ncbi:TetR/AcrR family transcriptional regulator C-terminal domain-containing protein [Thomasclavelia sp.]